MAVQFRLPIRVQPRGDRAPALIWAAARATGGGSWRRPGGRPAGLDRPGGAAPASLRYTVSVWAATRDQCVPCRALSTPAAPNAARRPGRRAGRLSRRPAQPDPGRHEQAGRPGTTVSVSPPTAVATTGMPQAIASSGTMPNGSYHGAQTTTSAERRSAGIGPGHPAGEVTRSATPCARRGVA